MKAIDPKEVNGKVVDYIVSSTLTIRALPHK